MKRRETADKKIEVGKTKKKCWINQKGKPSC